MRRMQITIGLLLLTLGTMAYAQANSARYVVTLKEDVSPAAIEQLAIRYGGRVDPLSSGSVRKFAVTMTPSAAQLLSGDARVGEIAPEASAAALSGRLHPASETYGSDGNSGNYSYDGSGNIIGIGADTFLYDAEGRLVRATIRGVQEDYVYDAFGNRTSATGATNCLGQSPCATPVTVSPSTNHLGGVSYDDAGSVTAASGATYIYDGTGMMTRSIDGSDDRQYVYTADDERIAVRQGVSWNWSVRDLGGKVLREYTSTEGASLTQTGRLWTKDYVWRDGLLLASTDATGTFHYHLDHLGTPRLITDANHVRLAEHAYYPFGSEISITPHESIEEPMKFTGHERDIVAGSYLTLDYMHARYYAATAGRFFSIDPLLDSERSMHSPQAWNRYSYVLNNPIGRVDPDGRADKPKLDNIHIELVDPSDHLHEYYYVYTDRTDVTVTAKSPSPQAKPAPPLDYVIADVLGATNMLSFIMTGDPKQLGFSYLKQLTWAMPGSRLLEFFNDVNTLTKLTDKAPSLPPGWSKDWQWRAGSRAKNPKSWWDPHGGEWRWHEVDRYHPEAHWDHNPWTSWSSPWTHVTP